MRVLRYTSEWQDEWNRLVSSSKSGTFMHLRSYMDYHADRFEDCSLLFFDQKDCLTAIFPANYERSTRTVWSHQGLTYGGILSQADTTFEQIEEAFSLMMQHYKQSDASRIIYKKIPYIYNEYPADEDLYLLFRQQATLYYRAISSAVPLRVPLPLSPRRIRGEKKAMKQNLYVKNHDETDGLTALDDFWLILSGVLEARHHTKPVHSLEEMKLLMARHPKNIRLHTVHRPDGTMVAGCLVYVTARVAHAQYIAANDEGRRNGALDLLFNVLLRETYKSLDYFDFGISTEDAGKVLNYGLLGQKQGFGARAVCYDAYLLNL